jgi:uncharacterized protein
VIIANAITPRFKTRDYAGGITRGVDDIITVLTTDASEWQKRPSLRLDRPAPTPVNWLAIAGIVVVIGLMIVSPAFRWMILGMLMSGRNSGGGGFGGGGFGGGQSGGGFSGGGGSSGGGGASGRW